MAIRAAGNHTVRLSQDGRGAGRRGDTQPRRHRPRRRPRRPHLGFALWNGRSQISLRFLSRQSAPPGPGILGPPVRRGRRLADSLLGLDQETDAYRVVHAEGDGLSGLIVDRFADVLSVEVFSLGIYQRIGPILVALADRLGTAHFRVGVDERVAQQEDFSGRPLARPAAAAARDRSRSTESAIASISMGATRQASFAISATTAAIWHDSARAASVLDLCCYTGGFGLNALIRGQAREVTCVDLDEKAVALARENGNANNVRLDVVHADAFGYARQMAQNARKLWRDRPRPSQVDPGPRRDLCR